MLNTIRDIVYFLASLFIFGLVYYVLNLIVSLLQNIFVIEDNIVIAVYFLWTLVPAIYYIAKAREFFQAREILQVK